MYVLVQTFYQHSFCYLLLYQQLLISLYLNYTIFFISYKPEHVWSVCWFICLRYLVPGIWEPLTLMDIQMKFMDGMTAARKIREMLIDCNVSLRLSAWSDCVCKESGYRSK